MNTTTQAGPLAAAAPSVRDTASPGPSKPSAHRLRRPAPAPQISDESRAATLAALRRFCSGEARADAGLEIPGGGWLPAALHPFRDPRIVRQDYPVFISPSVAGAACTPLGDLLPALASQVAPDPDQARILHDNVLRLEREIRSRFVGAGSNIVDARECLLGAAQGLEAALALKGEPARQLALWLDRLVNACPEGGVLIGDGGTAALDVLLAIAQADSAGRLATLRARADDLRRRIKDLIAAERAKGAGGQSGESLAGAVGGTEAARLNPDALSRLLGKVTGGARSDASRLGRLEQVLDTLTRLQGEAPKAIVHVVGETRAKDAVPGLAWHEPRGSACRTSSALFDQTAASFAPLFVAMRIAALELSGQFDEARHANLASAMTWRAFSREELLALPPIVAVEPQQSLAGAGMLELSRLLLSGRPIRVLVGVNAGATTSTDQDPLESYRLELGYLAIGHREALVHQSTVARPVHLADGFARGLSTTHAALHVVDTGLDSAGQQPGIGAWLHGGAAIEGRAHPLFHYDPERGETWARRLDFSLNPAPDQDWPLGEIPVEGTSGETTILSARFTFADFALLEPAFREQFRVVPDGLEDAALVEAAEYLSADEAKARDLIPTIWAADAGGTLRRVAFSNRLAFACRDRLDYWRTLQELSGARNEHVREAVQAERERLEAAFALERRTLEQTHAAEIERVRREAAGEALRRLAGALLDTDPQSLAAPAGAPAVAARPKPDIAPTQSAAPATSDAPVVVEEESGFDEPYVDTALCTSCNDCTNINSRVFVYNANKQVVIGDARAGTFAELVAAAEKCPARCIHPGKPLHPDEPGLADLVARAKPFN